MNFLDKLLGFLWLGDFVNWLNGKKTWLGVITFILTAVIIIVPVQFPELAYLAEIALRIREFLLNIGVDIQVLNVCGAALACDGYAHKVVKLAKYKKAVAAVKEQESPPKQAA